MNTTTSTISTKSHWVTTSPALLRGKDRLRYLRGVQGAIDSRRAKVILRAVSQTRKSADRSVS